MKTRIIITDAMKRAEDEYEMAKLTGDEHTIQISLNAIEQGARQLEELGDLDLDEIEAEAIAATQPEAIPASELYQT